MNIFILYGEGGIRHPRESVTEQTTFKKIEDTGVYVAVLYTPEAFSIALQIVCSFVNGLL